MPKFDPNASYEPVKFDPSASFDVDGGGGTTQTAQPGFWENLGHSLGIGKDEAAAMQQRFQDHPVRTVLEKALGPGYEALKGAGQEFMRSTGELGQAADQLKAGNPASAAVHAITAVPMVGPALNKMAQEAPATTPGQSYLSRVASAATPGNIGTALGTAAQVAPMVLGAADQVAPNRPSIPNPPNPALITKAQNYLRPPVSPAVVADTEMAARKLGAAVLPATKDASNFIKAAQEEVPNVIEYAKKTGNPLNTQLEFAKAAQGYAQEVRQFYDQEVLGPVANKVVKTSGTGFGDRPTEGPDTFATLGEIDKRVTQINTQLDSPTLNADDARRALASKESLQAEASKLRDILHQNLSQATGIPPDQIANIRQRVGRSYELANDTNAAVTARMQAAGKTDMGPVTLNTLPSRAVEFARGGPVPIADRAFQRAIKDFPGKSRPLPQVNAPLNAPHPPLRPSLASVAGIEAEPNPLQATAMSPEDSRAQVAAMNRSMARREASIQDRATQMRDEAKARFQRQQELLAKARAQQQAARKR